MHDEASETQMIWNATLTNEPELQNKINKIMMNTIHRFKSCWDYKHCKQKLHLWVGYSKHIFLEVVQYYTHRRLVFR
eukprot:UN03625